MKFSKAQINVLAALAIGRDVVGKHAFGRPDQYFIRLPYPNKSVSISPSAMQMMIDADLVKSHQRKKCCLYKLTRTGAKIVHLGDPTLALLRAIALSLGFKRLVGARRSRGTFEIVADGRLPSDHPFDSHTGCVHQTDTFIIVNHPDAVQARFIMRETLLTKVQRDSSSKA